MHISQVKIKGFRNYKSDIINFNEKTLIIGQNDIGKSNLLYALRLLLDKNISDSELELDESDFYVYEETNEIAIQIKFSKIVEACVVEKFKGYVHDSGDLFICLKAERDSTGKIETKFYAGKDEDSLDEISGRFYIKTLNIEYVGSSRNLGNYIKKERKRLLQDAMKIRTEAEVSQDNSTMDAIKTDIVKTNIKIKSLSYISRSTESVNNELSKMSSHHKDTDINFNVVTNTADDILNNLELVSRVNEKDLIVGGYGRNNQIFISLWTRKNQIQEEIPTSVTIYCIEEPEAHLHPHQQRKLARYLINELNGQVILSSHSPQIASEFESKSIIRLYDDNNCTRSANNGCSEAIEEAFDGFSYRLNIIPAEAFFSKAVLLVEGPSEELFYKALANSLGIDLDRLNISILKVDGIGFKIYIYVLKALGIKYVIRTDNDIFKNSNGVGFRCAGVQRCIDVYKTYFESVPEIEALLTKEESIKKLKRGSIPKSVQSLVNQFQNQFESIGLFLANFDLENDMYSSAIKNELESFYERNSQAEVVKKMTENKALTMYSFLKEHWGALSKLKSDDLAKPLIRCVELVGESID
jgi:putative ATP-dependent endonuclease of the OLD family